MVLFVGLLVVCLVAYGIATEMLLFPHQERSFDILFKIFYIPYWQIYGNLFLEEYNGLFMHVTEDVHIDVHHMWGVAQFGRLLCFF